jgi:SAM-dependent methyltransferase
MDGQALAIDDDSFDLAFSIFGVSLFNDWRTGLAEQVRVLRPGGKACIATWKIPPGGGPFLVMGKAIRAVFPESKRPAPPDGFVTLSDPSRFVTELEEAGLVDVQVVEVQAVWQGATGQAYLDELHDLHRFMPPYAALDEQGRREVDQAILRTIEEYKVGDWTQMVTPVLIATGTKP